MSHSQTNPLQDLIYSTLAFYERFGLQPQLEPATKVFQEEVQEFIEAANEGHNPQHTAEEAADVMVTIIGLCQAAGVDMEQLIQQVYAVIEKNNAKTYATHQINAQGKIARKKKSEAQIASHTQDSND